jgi:hypothetical protein
MTDEQLRSNSPESGGSAVRSVSIQRVESDRRLTFCEASELWEQKLRSIPSLFARLVYMSVLRSSTQKYVESELSSLAGRGVCHQVIDAAHVATLRQWLAMSLRAKSVDLKPYIASLGFRGSAVRNAQDWLCLAGEVVPTSASFYEKQLFAAALEAVVKLLDAMER